MSSDLNREYWSEAQNMAYLFNRIQPYLTLVVTQNNALCTRQFPQTTLPVLYLSLTNH